MRRHCHSSPRGRRSRVQAPSPPTHTGWAGPSWESPPPVPHTSRRRGAEPLPGACREDSALYESHASQQATAMKTDSNGMFDIKKTNWKKNNNNNTGNKKKYIFWAFMPLMDRRVESWQESIPTLRQEMNSGRTICQQTNHEAIGARKTILP